MTRWTERIKAESSDIPILSLEDLKELPSVSTDEDSGIYFLWLNGELQYIGKSRQISYRIELQIDVNERLRERAYKMQIIPFDKYTCLILHSGRIAPAGLDEKLKRYECAYIAHCEPPMNTLEQNPGT
jgi:hypothetical protein